MKTVSPNTLKLHERKTVIAHECNTFKEMLEKKRIYIRKDIT